LLVDDNADFAENLAEIIQDATGALVDIAPGGSAALQRAAGTRYDAIVSDMRMPVMSGAELVHRVRRIDPGLPAVVVTAYTNDDDLEAARHEGLLAVLPKPTPIPQLLELLSVARRDGLVALVEDDRALSDNISEALRSRGFATVTAASVLETERLGDVHPFAALVDLRVPGGPDGQAMERLAEKFPGLPLLVMTGHDVVPPRPHQALYRKPFNTADIVAALELLHARAHA
jgi:CheY-like chemotaxis protein